MDQIRALLWTASWMGLLGILLASTALAAKPHVPRALEAWQAWVLQDEAARNCPLMTGSSGQARDDFLCSWPGVLSLRIGESGAEFSQRWELGIEAWIRLPGDAEHWPQGVRINGQAAIVVENEEGPAVWMPPGSYAVEGRFAWERRPAALIVPPEAGLVDLVIDGQRMARVERDEDELLLGAHGLREPEADSLQVRVYRRVKDDIPSWLVTEIQIQAREEIMGPALPEGFAPLRLEGDWPARLEPDGRLRVRVSPGLGVLTLVARGPAPLRQVVAPVVDAPWPEQEIWSYEARPRQRITAPEGAVPVDPVESQVPDAWRRFPAFALDPGSALVVGERSRGRDPRAGNRLSLDRTLWLDFDGAGFFASDHISGTMREGWRLDVLPPLRLARASAGRGDLGLLVTHGAADGSSGVEWHEDAVNLDAGLRIARRASLPVTGWQSAFDRVQTKLLLPKGYRLLAAPGTEASVGAWVDQWTLLDVFAVAILVLMAWHALGWRGALLAAGLLLLGFQEPGMPRWSLFWVLAALLVWRGLPDGRLARVCGGLVWLALAVLVLIALPFAADQARQAIYPQLEPTEFLQAARVHGGFDGPRPMALDEVAVPMLEPPAPAAMAAGARPDADAQGAASTTLDRIEVTGSRLGLSPKQQRYEESSVIQTGAGEPAWSNGHQYHLRWEGPVLADQTVRLIILPPWLLRPLRLLLIVLLGLLGWGLVQRRIAHPLRLAATASIQGALVMAALAVSMLLPPSTAGAQAFPAPELLQELQQRLVRAPACAPDCASLARAELRVRGDELGLALEAHVVERSAVPLPIDARSLGLRQLRVDGVANVPVAVFDDEHWIALGRGVHRIEMLFQVSTDRVALRFPLEPYRIDHAVEGWELSGLDENRLQSETLTLVRARAPAEGEAALHQAQQFSPYARITRELRLGLDWELTTRVDRLAPLEGGVSFEIPLLDGEHVTSPGIKVRAGRASVTLAGNQRIASWSSRLDRSDRLQLVAPDLSERAESWRIQVGPAWHMRHAGVPETSGEAGGDDDAHWFEFDPLPGETLTLALSRPEPIAGEVRAIDAVQLLHEPGLQAATSVLSLVLRSSQGGEHDIALPAGAQLLEVRKDGSLLGLQLRGDQLSLPLTPGRQSFVIRFRTDAPLAATTRTPSLALGLPAANISLGIALPATRWLLATRGPAMGPAVLYWSELLVLVLAALVLARLPRSPLRLHQWLLLGLGFSTQSWWALLIVVAWLFSIGWRARVKLQSRFAFDLVQVVGVGLTALVLAMVYWSIQGGLLGQPDMHVVGIGSMGLDEFASRGRGLHWFADASPADALPIAQAFSLPVWVYRIAMLAWSLWLAMAMLRWLRQAFAAWREGGCWRRLWRRKAAPAIAPESAGEEATQAD